MALLVKQHGDKWSDALPHKSMPLRNRNSAQEGIKHLVLPIPLLPDCIWEECCDSLVLGADLTQVGDLNQRFELLRYQVQNLL